MDPITAISIGASVGSSIIGGIGQQQQYAAQGNQARYLAQVADNNRLIADQYGRYSAAAGRVNAQAQDYLTATALGRATVAQAAGGVDIGYGSPVDVRRSIRQVGRLKTLEEIQKSELDIYGYEAKATGFEAEAGLQRAKAAGAEQAGTTALFASILGGASSVADKWRMFQKVGV